MSMREIAAEMEKIKNPNISKGSHVGIDRLIDTYLHDWFAKPLPRSIENQAIVPMRRTQNDIKVDFDFDINELITKFSQNWFDERQSKSEFYPVQNEHDENLLIKVLCYFFYIHASDNIFFCCVTETTIQSDKSCVS